MDVHRRCFRSRISYNTCYSMLFFLSTAATTTTAAATAASAAATLWTWNIQPEFRPIAVQSVWRRNLSIEQRANLVHPMPRRAV